MDTLTLFSRFASGSLRLISRGPRLYWAWLAFLAASSDPAFVQATAPLRHGPKAIEIIVADYVAPLALGALALAFPAWAPGPTALAALLALVGQVRARSALILQAGQRRPVTLATLTLPRRSS